jgi:hypothetical protein
MLTQCVLTSFHLGTDHNPFYKVGRAVGRTVYQIAQSETADNDMTTEEEEQLLCVPPEPEPLQEQGPREPSTVSTEQRDFIIRTIKEQLPSPHIGDDFRSPPTDSPVRLVGEAELCSPPPSDEEDYPKFMPHCSDDGEVSPVVPHAADATRSSDPLFEFWLGLFESTAKEADDMGSAEPQEESRYFHDEEPPQCLEDPAYQHQYPGCPYTGKCSGQQPAKSPKMLDSMPTRKPKNDKKPSGVDMKPTGKSDPIFHIFNPNKYELPARLRQLLPGDSTEAEEEPSHHPEVDTMEFRPTDAKPGEFDPKPM